jgi:hypothetical protein
MQRGKWTEQNPYALPVQFPWIPGIPASYVRDDKINHKSMQSGWRWRRQKGNEHEQNTYPPPVQFILSQLYFYSARRPLPFRRCFPGIPASCVTKINQCINQFKVYIWRWMTMT